MGPCSSIVMAAALLFAAPDDDAARLQALAARCGSEIEWTTTWPEAAERARQQGRPIVALVRAYQGLQLIDLTMVAPFMEESIVELVRDRFVALRFRVGDPAPFNAPELYGIGPHAFGTTLLVVDPDGRVLGDTFTLEPTTLHDFLRSMLPADQRPPPMPRGEAGLAALTAAAATASGTRASALAVRRAELLIRLGRRDEASALLAAIPEADPSVPAALFFRGILETGDADRAKARATWNELIDGHASNRWAWLAAALLQFGYLELLDGGREPWPASAIAATVPRRPRAPLLIGRAAEAEHEAIRFLLDVQRTDGSWIFPGEVMSPVDPRDQPLVAAITAIAVRSLLPCAAEADSDPRVDGAIGRGLEFLRVVALRPTPPSPVLDYNVWSRSALLRCIAGAVDAGFAEPDEWHDVLVATTRALLASQRKGGGFSYYQGPDPAKPDPSLEISFSFVTAYVVLALREARSIGVDVPDEAIERAIGCLVRCRDADSTFAYGISHADETAGREPRPSGAAGRGPECEYALALCDRATPADVARALDHFLAHRAAFAQEQGKTLMHCGLEGEGSHYLLFDYAFAAIAAASLPEAQRSRWREPLLKLVLAARTDAGSFVDNPVVGDHAGTALALEALRALRAK